MPLDDHALQTACVTIMDLHDDNAMNIVHSTAFKHRKLHTYTIDSMLNNAWQANGMNSEKKTTTMHAQE